MRRVTRGTTVAEREDYKCDDISWRYKCHNCKRRENLAEDKAVVILKRIDGLTAMVCLDCLDVNDRTLSKATIFQKAYSKMEQPNKTKG